MSNMMNTHSSQVHGQADGTGKEQEYLEGWQRARAELDNFRNRVTAEREQDRDRLRRDVVQDLLGLADTLHAVQTHVPAELATNSWTQGVLHAVRQFDQLLEQLGVERIEGSGQAFNPILHEAVATAEGSGEESGQILEILQPGYKIGDTVLRPAKVKVTA